MYIPFVSPIVRVIRRTAVRREIAGLVNAESVVDYVMNHGATRKFRSWQASPPRLPGLDRVALGRPSMFHDHRLSIVADPALSLLLEPEKREEREGHENWEKPDSRQLEIACSNLSVEQLRELLTLGCALRINHTFDLVTNALAAKCHEREVHSLVRGAALSLRHAFASCAIIALYRAGNKEDRHIAEDAAARYIATWEETGTRAYSVRRLTEFLREVHPARVDHHVAALHSESGATHAAAAH
jgi:hypothetical protein